MKENTISGRYRIYPIQHHYNSSNKPNQLNDQQSINQSIYSKSNNTIHVKHKIQNQSIEKKLFSQSDINRILQPLKRKINEKTNEQQDQDEGNNSNKNDSLTKLEEKINEMKKLLNQLKE